LIAPCRYIKFIVTLHFFCRVVLIFTVIRGLPGIAASKAQDVEAGSAPHKSGEPQQDIAMNFPMSIPFE